MKKKGFTLIELLAVIVILAIIALIATPAVLNIIEDSRKGAAEASARNIVSAAKTYYMSETMNGRIVESIDLSTNILKYDGDQAIKGIVTFENGKASSTIYINGYCVEVAINGKVTSEKMDEEECEIIVTPSEPTTYTKYNNGAELLFDPVNNVKCSDNEVETNVNNFKTSNNNSITGLKEGCMKWYAFLDSEDSETVKLLLDHDIKGWVGYNDNADTQQEAVILQLQSDITNWNAAVKSTTRLISAEEINRIAPPAQGLTWDKEDWKTAYFFHTGIDDWYEGAAGTNTYAWLFNNTYNCERFGCNTSDSETSGYWTSTNDGGDDAWVVQHYGELYYSDYADGDRFGVRPVITVDKSVFIEN